MTTLHKENNRGKARNRATLLGSLCAMCASIAPSLDDAMPDPAISSSLPRPPAGRDEYFYGLGVLTPVRSELQSLTLSKRTRIAKARVITDPVGKQLLGDDALTASRKLVGNPWDAPVDRGPGKHRQLFPAFSPEYFSYLSHDIRYLRDYDESDHVIEVRFEANHATDVNEKSRIASKELNAALTALRLIENSGICIIGPAYVKVKQRAGIRQSLGFGNPDDATLGTPREPLNSLSNMAQWRH
jgi:hypothetical protein